MSPKEGFGWRRALIPLLNMLHEQVASIEEEIDCMNESFLKLSLQLQQSSQTHTAVSVCVHAFVRAYVCSFIL